MKKYTDMRDAIFEELYDIALKDKKVVVLSADNGPREGWEGAFKKMAAAGDDRLLEQDLCDSNFDKDEWEW